MKKWFCFFVLAPLIVFANPQNYEVFTCLKASQNQKTFFEWEQRIGLKASIDSSNSRALELTFTRIQGKGHYKDQCFEVDTDEAHSEHYDQLTLKAWLSTPFLIPLNASFEPPKKLKCFEDFIAIHPGFDDFFKTEGILQIVNALLCPKQFNPEKNLLHFHLFYPVPFKCTLTPNHSPQIGQTKLFFDHDLSLSQSLVLEGEKKQLHLNGDLAGEIIWSPGEDWVSKYSIHQVLDEKSAQLIGSSPVQFEYSFLIEKL